MFHLKWIINKDLLYSTWNSAQCYVTAWMGGKFGGEWIHVYVWLSPFIVPLKPSQHCSAAIPQYKMFLVLKKINLKKHKYVISPGQSSPKQISRGYMRSAHTSDIRSWRCQHRKSSWAFPVGNCEVCRDNGCGKPQFFLFFFFNIYWAAPGLSWGTGDLQFLLLHVEL